jgi:thimet oligopeptidase
LKARTEVPAFKALMMSTSALRNLLLSCALGWLGAAAAHAQTYAMPTYQDAETVNADCDRMLLDLKRQEADIQRAAVMSTSELLTAFDAMTVRYEDTGGPMSYLSAVHPVKAIRDAMEACELKYQAFNTSMQQNAVVFALLKKAKPLLNADQRFYQDLLNAFEDAGVGLSAAAQQRALALNGDITRLSQDFSRHIREDKTQVAFTAAELSGVPLAVWEQAKRNDQGRYLLGLDYPSSVPVIEQAHSAAARERMWRAVQNQGGVENLNLLKELGAKRRELASLFGFDSYANFVLRRRMAGSEERALAFLRDVKAVVVQRELADLALLRAAKARHLKQPLDATVMQRWDTAYYTERAMREDFAVNQEQFRSYFPPEASLKFAFKLAQTLFDVSFTPVKQTLWHREARAFEVRDDASGQTLGTFFVDLYPRADKYNHAAVWSFRNSASRISRLPVAAMAVNFNRQGLTLEELQTLLHEFGHGLHALLSKTRYASQGGTNVQLDFVEAPSQMLEDWVFDAKAMALFKTVCRLCKPVPAAMLKQAEQAKEFGKGIQVSRQHLFASYDLAFYGKTIEADALNPMYLWARMEGETPLGYVSDTTFPAGFEHIATGYASGYYSYLWSLVVAEDLRTAFVSNKLDAKVGRRYRNTLLSNGGQAAPADLLRQFLGRPTNSEAFFKALKK